jgi:hypothetical protein
LPTAPYSELYETIFISEKRPNIAEEIDLSEPPFLAKIVLEGDSKNMRIIPHIMPDDMALAIKFTRHYAQLTNPGIPFSGLHRMTDNQMIAYEFNPDGSAKYRKASDDEVNGRVELMDPALLSETFEELFSVYLFRGHSQEEILGIGMRIGITEEQALLIASQAEDVTATITRYTIWRLGDLLSCLPENSDFQRFKDPLICDISILLAGISSINEPRHFWHTLHTLMHMEINLQGVADIIQYTAV